MSQNMSKSLGKWPIHAHGAGFGKQDFGPSEQALNVLIAFKASERKDDPSRVQDIHGPYEEATIRKTGKLPPDYYTMGDAEPWGLREQESRSNILWQVLSGVMDRHAEFAASYMSLALDQSVQGEAYIKEVKKLNGDWGKYLDHAGIFRDHHHSSMGHTYNRVSCPACSTLTALACHDATMHDLFKEMLPLNARERQLFLAEKGLMRLLDVMIPETNPKPKP